MVTSSRVKEGSCITPPLLDMAELQWMFECGVDLWYGPMGSRYGVYRHGELLLKKPMEYITEEELANSCLMMTADKTHGFGGQVLTPLNEFKPNGVLEWKYLDTPAFGRAYMTLTDKSSYVVLIEFWDDTQEKSWMVSSTNKTLGPQAKEEILKHITSFGFDPANAHEINYENCADVKVEGGDDGDGDGGSGKKEEL